MNGKRHDENAEECGKRLAQGHAHEPHKGIQGRDELLLGHGYGLC